MHNLIRRLARQHAFLLAASVVLLAGFEYLMCAIVSAIDIPSALQQLMKNIPPFLRETIQDQFLGGLGPASILAFGWNHPIAQALGTALAIVLASRAVAGEIESGMMEMILSEPVSRTGYLGAQVIVALVSLGSLALIGAAGTWAGMHVYGISNAAPVSLSKLAVGYFLLQCAWYGITLALSVMGREGGRVATTAFILALISYLLQAIGKLWQSASFLLPYSLHTYYNPQSIFVGNELSAKSICVLAAVFVIGTSLAAVRFQKRDIP